MVCSACGFENATGMRFCGMCGTPLPHRPLTAPGAQGTLNLTRVPVDNGALGGQRTVSVPSSRRAGSPEVTGADGGTSATLTEQICLVNPADAVGAAPASVIEPPPKDLVPDVPLDEYVQNFHYQPPSDPTEITMRGDASVAEHAASANKATVTEAAIANETGPADAVAVSATSETKPVPETAAGAASDTVESRLGLEPETPAEAQVERPRFLDISESSKEISLAASGTSTVVGPSFLGLSDPPEVEAESGPAEADEVPGKSHWRTWLAVAVVLVFAGLGLMEWRSQVYQTDDGPVEIVKAKMRNWRNAIPASSQLAPTTSSPDNAKPEMQGQEPTQNQPGHPSPPASGPAVAAAPPSKAAAASKQQPATGQAASAERPANGNSKTSASSATLPTAAGKSQPPGQDATAKPLVPGAEELAKAKNASDSAAAAAWLWKSTAKGNPDAPVQLADMYIKGEGVPRSCEQAVVLLKTAAAKENARARSRLASMYATGDCVQRDRVEAYRWLSSALVANPNSEWAQQNRATIWQQMTPEERELVAKYR